MKKKFKLADFNFIFYFERKLLEDYLNDMAKDGYHYIAGNYRHKFEYNPDKHVYYHVDAIKTKKRYPGQVKPDESYIQLFEEQGYRFIGKWNDFHIFESEHKESIFSDEYEEDVVKDIFKREFKVYVPTFILDVLFIGLLLLVVFKGVADPVYIFLSDKAPMLILGYIPHIIADPLCKYFPLIRYKITKKVDYTYEHILIRKFIWSILTSLFIFIMLAALLVVNIRVIFIIMLLSMIALGLFVKLYAKDYVHKLHGISNWFLCGLIIPLILFANFNNAYELQHPSIKYKDYSQRSSLMEWAWYQLNDSEDMIYFIDVYEPLLTDYVFDSFIGENDYIQDGDTYFIRDYVVVRKENRILKMEKDFYENHLSSLEW